jgi:hypothetical protein
MRFLEKDPAYRMPSAVAALRTLPTLEDCKPSHPTRTPTGFMPHPGPPPPPAEPSI